MRALILSDGRMGHLNQCIALAKYAGYEYRICHVSYKRRYLKSLSYLLDRLHWYTDALFNCENLSDERFDYIIAAGSTTAYPLKVLARKYDAKSIAMMLPKGYRYDYDVIFAQSHDNPPQQDNICVLPANFSFSEPQGLYRAEKKSIGIVIGGDNKVFSFSLDELSRQLKHIFESFNGYEFAVTTSPRTSVEIEDLLEHYDFVYRVIYSKNPVNPIPDFLHQCDRVFITQDSTSMISEAVSSGKACIEVLPLPSGGDNKFTRLIHGLQKEGYLHIYDGTFADANRKIDFTKYIHKAGL